MRSSGGSRQEVWHDFLDLAILILDCDIYKLLIMGIRMSGIEHHLELLGVTNRSLRQDFRSRFCECQSHYVHTVLGGRESRALVFGNYREFRGIQDSEKREQIFQDAEQVNS